MLMLFRFGSTDWERRLGIVVEDGLQQKAEGAGDLNFNRMEPVPRGVNIQKKLSSLYLWSKWAKEWSVFLPNMAKAYRDKISERVIFFLLFYPLSFLLRKLNLSVSNIHHLPMSCYCVENIVKRI